MKKLVSVLLLLALVLSLCACSEGGESDKKATGKLPALGDYDLYAGYSRKNVTPLEPVGLGGYSNPAERTHKAVIDKIYVTAIALTDAKGKTILLMNWDGVRSYTGLQDAVRTAIAQELGIEKNDIFFGATHTHSAPDLTYTSEATSRYINFAMEQILACAREAYHDRRPARMSVGSIETESLNFVRHYMTTNEDGTISYFGDNFGSAVYNETTAHTSQADSTMFMLHFEMAEGKDMCLINWRAHPHFTGSSGKYDLSSDYVGAFRDAFEYTTGVDMLYFNGAAGNVNEKSRIKEENRTVDYKAYGKLLSDYATELMNNNLEQVEVDEIKTTSTVLTLKTHSQNHLLNDAGIFKAVYSATKSTAQASEATEGRVRSRFHANAIQSGSRRAPTDTRELSAILLGDSVGLIAAPNELFDTNTVWVEEHSPTKYTLTLGYTNGHHGYMPSAYAWEYTSYETDISALAPGAAEQYQQCFLDMLNEMYAQ